MGTEIPPANMFEICRLCSSSEGNRLPIFSDEDGNQTNEPLSFRIMTCVNVSVCVDDTLSMQICESCLHFVTTWWQFKKECDQAQEKQKKWLSPTAVSTVPDGGLPIKSEPIETDEVDEASEEACVNDYVIKLENVDISDEEDIRDSRSWGHSGPVSPPHLSNALGQGINWESPNHQSDANAHIEEINLTSPTAKKKYQCTTCDKFLASRAGLAKHKQIHSRSVYPCLRCNKPCTSAEELAEHMRSHNVVSSTFCCTKCKKNCRGEERLRKHLLKCNPAMDGHTCMACKRSFLNTAEINAHMIRRHTKFCHICQESFPNCLRLEAHMRASHSKSEHILPKKSYTCNICRSAFSHWYQLRLHKQLHERNQIPSSPGRQTAQAVYKCPQCPRTFTLWKEYADHKQTHLEALTSSGKSASTHTEEKVSKHSIFRCNSCQVSFPRFQNLMQHRAIVHPFYSSPEEIDSKPVRVRVTSQSEPGSSKRVSGHFCHICFKKCTTSGLERHMLSHSNEKLYSCPVCQIRLKYPFSVQKHLFLKHGLQYELSSIKPDLELHTTTAPLQNTVKTESGKAWCCPSCSKRFDSKDSMIKHHRIYHNNIYKVKCKICSQLFRDATALNAHEQSHVKPDPEPSNVDNLFQCDVCPLYYRSYKSLKAHQTMKNHFKDSKSEDIKIKIFSCTSCHNSYNNGESLRIHRLKKHGIGTNALPASTVHTCHVCMKIFVKSSSLKSHLFKKHSISNLPNDHLAIFCCHICSKTFDKESALTSHRGWHSRTDNCSPSVVQVPQAAGKKQRTCHICKKEFLSSNALKLHYNFHSWDEKMANNLKVKAEVSTSLVSKVEVAKLPKKEVSSVPSTKKHRGPGRPPKISILASESTVEKSHTKVKQERNFSKHPANIASTVSEPKSLLVATVQKNIFKCTECDMSYPSKKAVMAHQRWHSRSCRYCHKKFYQKHKLHGHLLICSQRKHCDPLPSLPEVSKTIAKQECKSCGKKFTRLGNLSNHVRVCKLQKNNDTTRSLKEKVTSADGKDAKENGQQKAPTFRSQSATTKPKRPAMSNKLFGVNRKRKQKGPSTCDVCSQEFKLFRSMITHRMWHSRHAKVTLNQESAPSPPTLDELHAKEQQSATKPFSCEFCTESFVSKMAYGTHRSLHLRKLARTDPKTALLGTIFTCKSCPNTFDSYSKFNRHHQKHIREIFPPKPLGFVRGGRRRKRCTKPQPLLDSTAVTVDSVEENTVEKPVTVEVTTNPN